MPDLVLLHGYTATYRTWERVAPFLPRDWRLHPLPLRGHGHGRPLAPGTPATLAALVEGVEADMDERGLERAHVVGSSLGGWIGLELAARGRAQSLLGIGTAGFWNGRSDPTNARRRRIFDSQRADALRARPLLPLLYALAPARRFALRNMAVHGERASRAELLEITRGMLACTVHPELFEATLDGGRRYADLPCPVRMRLPEHDRLFPPEEYVALTVARVPQADVAVLPGTGHLPMLDDPGLVAREIMASVRAASPG